MEVVSLGPRPQIPRDPRRLSLALGLGTPFLSILPNVSFRLVVCRRSFFIENPSSIGTLRRIGELVTPIPESRVHPSGSEIPVTDTYGNTLEPVK